MQSSYFKYLPPDALKEIFNQQSLVEIRDFLAAYDTPLSCQDLHELAIKFNLPNATSLANLIAFERVLLKKGVDRLVEYCIEFDDVESLSRLMIAHDYKSYPSELLIEDGQPEVIELVMWNAINKGILTEFTVKDLTLAARTGNIELTRYITEHEVKFTKKPSRLGGRSSPFATQKDMLDAGEVREIIISTNIVNLPLVIEKLQEYFTPHTWELVLGRGVSENNLELVTLALAHEVSGVETTLADTTSREVITALIHSPTWDKVLHHLVSYEANEADQDIFGELIDTVGLQALIDLLYYHGTPDELVRTNFINFLVTGRHLTVEEINEIGL